MASNQKPKPKAHRTRREINENLVEQLAEILQVKPKIRGMLRDRYGEACQIIINAAESNAAIQDVSLQDLAPLATALKLNFEKLGVDTVQSAILVSVGEIEKQLGLSTTADALVNRLGFGWDEPWENKDKSECIESLGNICLAEKEKCQEQETTIARQKKEMENQDLVIEQYKDSLGAYKENDQEIQDREGYVTFEETIKDEAFEMVRQNTENGFSGKRWPLSSFNENLTNYYFVLRIEIELMEHWEHRRRLVTDQQINQAIERIMEGFGAKKQLRNIEGWDRLARVLLTRGRSSRETQGFLSFLRGHFMIAAKGKLGGDVAAHRKGKPNNQAIQGVEETYDNQYQNFVEEEGKDYWEAQKRRILENFRKKAKAKQREKQSRKSTPEHYRKLFGSSLGNRKRESSDQELLSVESTPQRLCHQQGPPQEQQEWQPFPAHVHPQAAATEAGDDWSSIMSDQSHSHSAYSHPVQQYEGPPPVGHFQMQPTTQMPVPPLPGSQQGQISAHHYPGTSAHVWQPIPGASLYNSTFAPYYHTGQQQGPQPNPYTLGVGGQQQYLYQTPQQNNGY